MVILINLSLFGLFVVQVSIYFLCSVYFVYYLQYDMKSYSSSLVCLVICEPRLASLTLVLGTFLHDFFEKKFPVYLA